MNLRFHSNLKTVLNVFMTFERENNHAEQQWYNESYIDVTKKSWSSFRGISVIDNHNQEKMQPTINLVVNCFQAKKKKKNCLEVHR